MSNTINIKGNIFNYEVYYDCSEFDDYIHTIFYKDKIKKSRKRFILFGKESVYYKPIELFRVWCDITDRCYTKTEMKEIIERVYDKYMGLLNREEEIKNNEII